MAEIPIERKERSNLLPLLLLGLLLLGILGYCFLRPKPAAVVTGADSTRAVTATADTGRSGTAGAAVGAATGAAAGAMAGGDSSAVSQFAQFVQQRDTTQETEEQHAYTSRGVRLLAGALDQVAGQSGQGAIKVYADSMRSSIDRLQRRGPKDAHAGDAKAAFSAAVSAMTVIDKAQGKTYDVAPMRAIYNRLKPGQPLLPQLATVNEFFQAADGALKQMGVPGANAAGNGAAETSGGTKGAGQ